VPALSEADVGQPARSLVLVVHHDDNVVPSVSRRRLDQWHLARKEVVELRVAIVDWRAVALPVVAAVRDDQVEVRDVCARERRVEIAHRVS
jgi:hypothetical protein